MTNVLIYWRNFRKNAEGQITAWHSNAKLLGGFCQATAFWFVTSGKNLRQEAEQAGFLVAVWQVREVKENAGDDPAYPKADYRYRIIASDEGSVVLDEPVLVDHILRPEGRDKAASIGRFLQGPRKLDDQKVRLLRTAAGPKMALKWLTGNRGLSASGVQE